MNANRKAVGFGVLNWIIMATAGIGLALMVGTEMAYAGKLYPRMVPANLVDVEVQFQTIELNSRLYGKRELKLLQFTPLDNPNYVCQGFLRLSGSDMTHSLANLSSYTCFPKANREKGRVNVSANTGDRPSKENAPKQTVSDEELVPGIENGWQEKQENAQPSFGEPGTVSQDDEFGGWNNTRVK